MWYLVFVVVFLNRWEVSLALGDFRIWFGILNFGNRFYQSPLRECRRGRENSLWHVSWVFSQGWDALYGSAPGHFFEYHAIYSCT